MNYVSVSGKRLNEIWLQENLGAEECTHSFLNLWCDTNCKFSFTSDIRPGEVIWFFDDIHDTILFKLTWA